MSVALKLFLLVQFFFLVYLIVEGIREMRRQKQINEILRPSEADIEVHLARARGRFGVRPEVPRPVSPSEAPKAPPPAKSPPPLRIESLLPSWDDSTPAHEVLGVQRDASRRQIEKAHKALLKKYHPDRVAQFGKGYQTRAHYVVLRINSARDELIAKVKN